MSKKNQRTNLSVETLIEKYEIHCSSASLSPDLCNAVNDLLQVLRKLFKVLTYLLTEGKFCSLLGSSVCLTLVI